MNRKTLFILIAILFSIKSYSQSSPGNVSSNLKLWLSAGSLPTGSVSSWTDDSGNGNSPSQNSSADQPVNLASQINYNPAVSFDDSTDFLEFNGPSLGTLGNTSKEIFYVAKSGEGMIFFVADTSNSGKLLNDKNIGYKKLTTYNSIVSSRTNNPLSREEACGERLIANIKNENETSLDGSHYKISSNGTFFTHFNDSINNGFGKTNVNAEKMMIGARLKQNGTFASFYGGVIGEVIFYSSSISSATDRKQIVSYLGIKYGESIGHDYLSSDGLVKYDISTYGENIIALARDDNSTLLQKQSQTPDDTTRVYLSTLQTTNTGNLGSFANDTSYLIIGDNGGAMESTPTANTEKPTSGIQSRIEREWKVTKSNLKEEFSMDFKLSANAGSVTIAHLRMLVDDDGDFSNGGTTIYSNGDAAGTVISYSSSVITVSGISNTHISNNATKYITIASTNTLTPLPVEFANFQAVITENGFVNLNWQTASELNNDYFEVQRMANNNTWQTIGFEDGAGTSNEILTYNFKDENLPNTSKWFYRIKQIDFDGQIDFSDVEAIRRDEVSDLKIFPNQAKVGSTIYVQSNSEKDIFISVYSLKGEEVLNSKEQIISTSMLEAGLYIIKVQYPNRVIESRKLFLF